MFLLLKELSPPDGLPARTHPLGRGVFNETPSLTLDNYVSIFLLTFLLSMTKKVLSFLKEKSKNTLVIKLFNSLVEKIILSIHLYNDILLIITALNADLSSLLYVGTGSSPVRSA